MIFLNNYSASAQDMTIAWADSIARDSNYAGLYWELFDPRLTAYVS